MKILLGIAVDDEVFEEYAKKRYAVNYDGKTDMLPLKTVELAASSKDYAAMPEYQESCRKVLQEVKTEIQNLYRRKAGRVEIMKHDTFDGYIADLQAVYQKAAGKREELRTARDKAAEEWHKTKRDESASEYTLTSAKMKYLDAEAAYKEEIEKLQSETNDEVSTVRQEFEEHLNSFYTVDGAKLDDDTVRLLNSGLVLRKEEAERIASRYQDNPTMIRLVDDYCNKHSVKSDLMKAYGTAARSGGEQERKLFGDIAGLISKAVSSNEVTAKVWRPESGHFDRLSGEAAAEMQQMVVKPEAC